MFYLLLLASLIQFPKFKSKEYLALPYKNGFSIITHDSLYVWEDEKGWSSQQLKATDFNLNDKIVFYANNRSFVVSAGIGLLYELRGDSLVRLDNSFDWRSRYNTNLSFFEDKIYSFGGYGLWTPKNNLVNWDPLSKEWNLEEYASSKNVPSGISHGIISTQDSLFFYMESFYLEKEDYQTKEVYQYNFNTRNWTIKGVANDVFFDYNTRNTFVMDNLFLFDKDGDIVELDFVSNSFKNYQNPARPLLKDTRFIIANPMIGKVMVLTENGIDKFEIPHIVDLSIITGEKFLEYEIYSKDNSWIKYLLSSLALLFIIALIWFRVSSRSSIKLILKNIKLIDAQLNADERKLLKALLISYPNPIKLPDLLADFGQSLTFDSKIKKFRKSIKHIENVISDHTILKSDIFIYSKNIEDKRIKEIKIRSKF